MSTPASKRRRTDSANQTLTRPFRSPFKTPYRYPVKDQTSQEISPIATSELASKNQNDPLSTVTKPSNIMPRAIPTCRSGVRKQFASPIQAAALNADPDIALLFRAQKELENQLRDTKELLETAEQAKRIEVDSRKKDLKGEIDGELTVLIEKWKEASRQAAEELFSKVRDKVNRMGGPRAWKDMQKQQQGYQGGWDSEESTKINPNADGDEKEGAMIRDLYAEYDVEPETENEKSQRAPGLDDTGELPGEEDEFTMAMMLRTLNIDLEVIGYDRQQQRWFDS